MKRSSREKIALVVFMLLAIGGLIGLGWYIVAGHSWNVAASTIDDTVGEMEGYTAIIYPGTTEPLEKDDAAARGSEPRTSLLSPLGREDPEPVDLEALVAEYEEKAPRWSSSTRGILTAMRRAPSSSAEGSASAS